MTLDELMQEVVNMSPEERVKLGKSCVNEILEEVKDYFSKEKYAGFIFAIVKLFVCADQVCSQEEYELICSIYDMNMSYDDFYAIIEDGVDPAFIEKMDEIIDSATPSLKKSICLFGLCILASDDTITVAEQELLNKILE